MHIYGSNSMFEVRYIYVWKVPKVNADQYIFMYNKTQKHTAYKSMYARVIDRFFMWTTCGHQNVANLARAFTTISGNR